MIEIRRATDLTEDHRHRVTEVLVTGFADDFAFFSRDPERLTAAFAHMIVPDRFHVAVVDGTPAAVATVTEGTQDCFSPDGRELRRVLGRVHGTICHRIIRSHFMGGHDDARPGLAEIGFVTTAPRFQGRGVATALMRRLVELPYDEFVLRDIKDTNTPALGLYRKLGFVETGRRPVRFAKRAGFSEYVSMGLRRVRSGADDVRRLA